MKEFEFRIDGGYFYITVSEDPNYPGIDIEFVADDDEGKNASRPRIVFEKPIGGKLRVLIWANKDSEDYSDEIELE